MTKSDTMRLINLLVSIRRLPPLSDLSGDEERFLFELHEIWVRRGMLSVADAYDLGGVKSASTGYRLLMALKAKGLVSIAVNEEDKRKRQVAFTDTALRLFASLG